MGMRQISHWWTILVLLIWMGGWSCGLVQGEAYFSTDSAEEWHELLIPSTEGPYARPGTPGLWEEYLLHWNQFQVEGEPFAQPREMYSFLTPDLYVFEGPSPNPEWPEDASLIMAWGGPDMLPDGRFYSSAWQYEYGLDPDLRNCTITLKVHPPVGITNVSFGLTDINGNQVSWAWNVPGNIPNSPPPTTITINTNNINLGMAAPVPAAGAFAINPGFDLSQVQSFFINETFHNVPGTYPAPPPGGSAIKLYWNAWDEFSVVPNAGGGGGQVNSKWFVKWSQPPDDTTVPEKIFGWDERSVYHRPPILADDWQCKDNRPVTDIHWWGSFFSYSDLGLPVKCWTQPYIPAHLLPKGFHIGIWTDIPAGADQPFSHPGRLVWENYCTSYVWNFAGYDYDPRVDVPDHREREACFQFAQFLSQNEWFRQAPDPTGEGTVYWLSIAAFYDPTVNLDYLWGWKTRPHFFNDDAVRIHDIEEADGSLWPWGTMPMQPWPPHVGAHWLAGEPVEAAAWVEGQVMWLSWDLAFELTTNEPAYEDHPIPGDLNVDKKVDLLDFAIFAAHWLDVHP